MRTAIISDIHANVDALAAILHAIESEGGIAQIVSLGDVVGYNAFPRETIATMRQAGIAGVVGNHDLMVLGRISPMTCGPRGRKAVAWTSAQISPDDRKFLESLPEEIHRGDDLLFMHSMLGDQTGRLRTPLQFLEEHWLLARRHPGIQVCFTGHTHEQHVTWITPGREVRRDWGSEVALEPGCISFVNPGSVGEPRGADERAAFAIYDHERRTVRFRLVEYDRGRVLGENARQGLPVDPQPASLGTRVRGFVRRAASLVSSGGS